MWKKHWDLKNKMNIAIIGCGIIGEKRLNALGEHKLVFAADKNISRAQRLCDIKKQGKPIVDWKDIISTPEVDIVIVATTNDSLAEITAAALKCNKHILVEKPAGRNPEDLREVTEAQKKSKAFVKVGFNHRFHPALLKAKEIISSESIGELMFIRGRYGHGGRKGYEKEWRFNKDLSGGGELLDQGVHLIDLSRWMFDCEFTGISGYTNTYFWNADLEDNGFLQLLTEKKQMAWLHVSATEWKNMFCMEIYGKYGKLQIDGLGGSYGIERLAYYKMSPEMGPPETTIWEYPFPDNSWKLEFDYFVDCIEKGIQPEGNPDDAERAIGIVYKIYEGNGK